MYRTFVLFMLAVLMFYGLGIVYLLRAGRLAMGGGP